MASSAIKFSYQRLKHEGDHEFEADGIYAAERFIGKSRPWLRLKRVSVKRRLRVKVPSLRRFLRKKVKLARVSFGKVVKRLKESQTHFSDIFAGNYMFIQVNPTTMKCFEKSRDQAFALKNLPSSRYSLSRIA